MKQRVGFISLGCPKNQLDCELMISTACDAGFEPVADISEADAIIINTCAFILPAQSETDEAIREAVAEKGQGNCRAVVVTGCLPQYLQERRSSEYPEVDAWLTPDNPGDIGEVLQQLLTPSLAIAGEASSTEESASLPLPTFLASSADGRVLTTPPSLAYVKLAEGCNHGCKFCIIPKLRGKYRSRSIADITSEARELAELGIPEIVLVSQDSSYYGRDLSEGGLPALLESLHGIPGDCWLRVMYLYPSQITEELLTAWAQLSPRLLPYFDVPVQHVSRAVLKRMGRGGDRDSIDSLFASIREACPGAVIRTTLIVGFPGETAEEFAELLSWVESGAVDRLGVFTYSDLPELPSHSLPGHLDEDEMEHRQGLLMEAQFNHIEQKMQALIGSECDVLLEEAVATGAAVADAPVYAYMGRSWRDAYEIDGLMRVESSYELPLYHRLRVRITGADGYDLIASALP